MFKGERRWGSSVSWFLLSAFLVGGSAFAEDPAPAGTGLRNPRIRVAPPRPAPAPVRPRPIQDETTAASVAPATAPPASVPPSQNFGAPRAAVAPQNFETRAPAPVAAPVRAVPRRSQEQAVDLNALSTSTNTPSSNPVSTASGRSSAVGGMSPHQSGGIVPNFKFYFDFLLKSWKGDPNAAAFSFDSFHQRMMVEFTPTPDLMFQADISSWQSPKYYEVDYMLSPKVQLRWGRIWIPFDDMSPHSVFGGRINTSEFFQPNETAFLPDIWADMGMGLKFTLADSASFGSDLHVYVVNGFQSGGTSPVAGETGVEYPNFAGTSGASSDNNDGKGMGVRWHGLMGRRFGVGTSIYRDSYSSKSSPEQKGLQMIGADFQLYPSSTTEIRVGFVSMKVDLYSPPTAPLAKANFTRGGSYIELGQKFGQDNRWKFLVRAGKSQNDNRVVDVSDKTLVGATLLRNFGNVEAQLTYYKDMNQVASKIAYNYGALRLVTAF